MNKSLFLFFFITLCFSNAYTAENNERKKFFPMLHVPQDLSPEDMEKYCENLQKHRRERQIEKQKESFYLEQYLEKLHEERESFDAQLYGTSDELNKEIKN